MSGAAVTPPEGTQPRPTEGKTIPPPPSTTRIRGAPGWRAWTALVAMIVSSAIAIGARTVVRDDGDPRLAVAVALIALTLTGLGVAILFASLHGTPTAADFGLHRPPLVRAAGLVIAVLVGVSVLSAVWVVAVGLDDDAPSVTSRLAAGNGALNALLVLVLVAVASPLAEEFLFRGYAFRALSNWRGVWPAAMTTSVVFAVSHIGWSPIGLVVPVGVFGFGACILYHWSGSLYAPLAMHALLNASSFGTVFEGWQLPVAIVFAVAATLLIGRLVAVLLGGGGLSERREESHLAHFQTAD